MVERIKVPDTDLGRPFGHALSELLGEMVKAFKDQLSDVEMADLVITSVLGMAPRRS
jgi:hypothetical protein